MYKAEIFKSIFISTVMASIAGTAVAKDKEGVIMTVDGESVPTEEFLYLFQKNNLQQSEPQSLDDYLGLFEIYRLKVAEAKKEGIDTTANFIKEIDIYKRELLEPFIADTVFFNSLVDIAAEREKTFVESSHIMFMRTRDENQDKRNLEILDSLRTEIINGADFVEIAKTYSQDKFSSHKGGYLGFTPTGTFPYVFETAVYETPEGDISEIIESHVGYHIVKSGARKSAEEFNKKPRSHSEIKNEVQRMVASPFDSRFHEIRANQLKNLKEKYPQVNLDGMNDETAYQTLIKREEDEQYKNNPEYRNLVDEYVNGSLLYEVSIANIWDKAANDTAGLEAYYNSHKDKYKWDSPHAKGFIVKARNDSTAGVIRQEIAGLQNDSVVPYIVKNFKKNASVERFNISQGVNDVIDVLMFSDSEKSQNVKNLDNYIILEGKIIDAPEGVDDVKSLVINDYQEELEKDWVSRLRQNHKVEINNRELARIRKKMK